MNPRAVAEQLLAALPEFYLEAEARTGSCYLRCKDPRVGTIRIADHPGRYSYRYQVDIDVGAKESRYGKSGRVRHYGFQELDLLVRDVRKEWQRRSMKSFDKAKQAERIAAWTLWRESRQVTQGRKSSRRKRK